MAWTRLAATQWRYCSKVGLAAALGYLLTQGGYNQYALYSAITAALIVGANLGEDLATSGNRVKGTLTGMAAGIAVSALFGPSTLAMGLAVALTALLTLALGWGVPVARIGATLCIVTLVAHGAYALEYDLMRAANTLIGLAIGLAVSLFVWPVRARDEVRRAVPRVLEAAAKLLDAAAAGERDLRPAQLALYDAVAAMVKAARDAKLERRARLDAEVPDAHALQVLQLGLEILAALLREEAPQPSLPALRRRLDALRPTSSSAATS
jgi:uncharacterized membrane protein YccC